MTRSIFSLFQSHLDLAHAYWKRHLKKGSIVLDATCGNGHDSLILAQLTLSEDKGALFCFDIQKEALEKTHLLLQNHLPQALMNRVELFLESHEVFPLSIPPCDLIVYNLGYLPGASKNLTTREETTLLSLKNALSLLNNGGIISMMCYPGHEEGAREEISVINYVKSLDPKTYLICHHSLLNRRSAPSLLLICKKN